MVKRVCPYCGREWYSAYEQGDWYCTNCHMKLGPELNEVAR